MTLSGTGFKTDGPACSAEARTRMHSPPPLSHTHTHTLTCVQIGFASQGASGQHNRGVRRKTKTSLIPESGTCIIGSWKFWRRPSTERRGTASSAVIRRSNVQALKFGKARRPARWPQACVLLQSPVARGLRVETGHLGTALVASLSPSLSLRAL